VVLFDSILLLKRARNADVLHNKVTGKDNMKSLKECDPFTVKLGLSNEEVSDNSIFKHPVACHIKPSI
jgi:hypothetical protein